jgi:hypothetical protein
MQPEGAITQRLRGAFKELCLRVSGDATLTIIKVAFRKTDASKQRRDFNVVLSKRGNRLTCGKPGRCRQNLPGSILDHMNVPSTVAEAGERLSSPANTLAYAKRRKPRAAPRGVGTRALAQLEEKPGVRAL